MVVLQSQATGTIGVQAIAVQAPLVPGAGSKVGRGPGVVEGEGGRTEAQRTGASSVVVVVMVMHISVPVGLLSDVLIHKSSEALVYGEHTWTQFHGSAVRTSQ